MVGTFEKMTCVFLSQAVSVTLSLNTDQTQAIHYWSDCVHYLSVPAVTLTQKSVYLWFVSFQL